MEPIPFEQEISVFPNLENPLEIKIPTFEGPLDLLLHLIRKKELDIYKVQLSELTNSYLAYLEYMDSINLDYAGEFLETAATLIWIKSKQLLPKPVVEEDVEEEDPEELLRQQLIEYQKYKQAAFILSNYDLLGRDVFTHPEIPNPVEEQKTEEEQVFAELSLYGLMEAFQRLMARPRKNVHVIEVEEYSMDDRVEELIRMFTLRSEHLFEELFSPEQQTRPMLILTFMAVLEMVKLQMVCVVQEAICETIYCRASDNFHENVAKWFGHQPPVSELELHIA